MNQFYHLGGEGDLSDRENNSDGNNGNDRDFTSEDDYIYQDDDYLFQEDNAGYTDQAETVPASVVNLYNQLDTRGELGGVHSGRVLLKTFKKEDGSITMQNFDSPLKLTGVSMYNPKIKHNGMVSCHHLIIFDF